MVRQTIHNVSIINCVADVHDDLVDPFTCHIDYLTTNVEGNLMSAQREVKDVTIIENAKEITHMDSHRVVRGTHQTNVPISYNTPDRVYMSSLYSSPTKCNIIEVVGARRGLVSVIECKKEEK